MGKRKRKLSPDLSDINYKNVSLLSNYTDSSGKITGRRQNGLDAKKQRAMSRAIKQARSIGLLAY